MTVLENVCLAPLTTLKVGGPARYFTEPKSVAEVAEAVNFARSKDLPFSCWAAEATWWCRTRVGRAWSCKLASGIEQREENGKTFFEVGAGEEWDRFVAFAVARNCAGVECLSGIPGSVGGTPVQNVGAYGQEVSETIDRCGSST